MENEGIISIFTDSPRRPSFKDALLHLHSHSSKVPNEWTVSSDGLQRRFEAQQRGSGPIFLYFLHPPQGRERE